MFWADGGGEEGLSDGRGLTLEKTVGKPVIMLFIICCLKMCFLLENCDCNQ